MRKLKGNNQRSQGKARFLCDKGDGTVQRRFYRHGGVFMTYCVCIIEKRWKNADIKGDIPIYMGISLREIVDPCESGFFFFFLIIGQNMTNSGI